MRCMVCGLNWKLRERISESIYFSKSAWALGTPFFARFTALLLGRKGLLPLSDDRVADGTRQDESDGNKENLFHGT